ncbi:MAG: hypothetical protein AMXMBFR37_05000 [Steroidobacteraceae bacterium]
MNAGAFRGGALLAALLPLGALADGGALAARAAESRVLDRAWLTGSGNLAAPLPMAEFTPRAGALPPRHAFEGRLVLEREATLGAMHVLRDDYATAQRAPQILQHLPPFDFVFVTHGDVLIPAQRGLIGNRHPQWEYVLEPGRIWQESADGDYTRAALPFALVERNANCVHNGVLSFLFDGEGQVSRVAYQVSSETCAYLKIDLWGVLPARYRPGRVPNRDALVAAYDREVAARLPVRPIAALAIDHPGADPAQFGQAAEVSPANMTAFGFIIDGVHYVGGCDTRQGPYPFCDVLTLPSYSLAKSLAAGLGSMHLALRFPSLFEARITDYVPECRRAGHWQDVSFGNLLDMASGHYDSTVYDEDESSAAMLDFFQAEDHMAKIRFACSHFPRRAAPGTRWVYHTSDTYLLGTALQAFVRRHLGKDRDFYTDVVAGSLWAPLGLSPVLQSTRRTRDLAAQPFTGWGLLLHRDDIARIGRLLGERRPAIGGAPLFDATALDQALQRDPAHPGLEAIDASFRYAHGFWAHDVSPYIGCATPTWVPYMAGFGGITVLLLPNDTVYYYFSDGGEFRWSRAASEADRVRPYCAADRKANP